MEPESTEEQESTEESAGSASEDRRGGDEAERGGREPAGEGSAGEGPEDHHPLSDELESDAREMKERSDSLGEEISETRTDWRQKQQDEGIAGADPPGGSVWAEDEEDEDAERGDKESTSRGDRDKSASSDENAD